jgi:hypothetical protein
MSVYHPSLVDTSHFPGNAGKCSRFYAHAFPHRNFNNLLAPCQPHFYFQFVFFIFLVSIPIKCRLKAPEADTTISVLLSRAYHRSDRELLW